MNTLDNEATSKMAIYPIKDRWMWLAIGMGLSLIANAFQMMDIFKMNELLNRVTNGDTGAAYQLVKMQQQGLTPVKALAALVGIASLVFICMWFYRASQNVHQAGMNFLNYSPGWNVGWFFIPVAHIIMPVLVLRETVKASLSINRPDEYSSWPNNKVIPTYAIWAACFLVRMLAMYFMIFYTFSMLQEIARQNPDAIVKMVRVQIYIAYISLFLTLIEGIMLIMFSKKITDIQEQYRAE